MINIKKYLKYKLKKQFGGTLHCEEGVSSGTRLNSVFKMRTALNIEDDSNIIKQDLENSFTAVKKLMYI